MAPLWVAGRGGQSRTVNASVFNIQTEPYVPATAKAMSLDRVPT